MKPNAIKIKDFNYLLPNEKIAVFPLANRDDSKLLIVENDTLKEDIYRNLGTYLPPECTLVFNNTKVIEARLLFQKPSGATIEIFLLEPTEIISNYETALAQNESSIWNCMVGGAGKWKHGTILEKTISINNIQFILTATIIDKQSANFIISFNWQPTYLSFAEILHHFGNIPLPPYIKRQAEALDTFRYQTVYAKNAGSVAAPTAGLHFTPALLEDLEQQNIRQLQLTLHVGAGTFKPVTAETLADHSMHAELIEVEIDIIEKLAKLDGVYAVGTTALRSLESLYWMGVKIAIDPTISPENLHINQWEIYEKLESFNYSANDALNHLLIWMKKNQLQCLVAKTQLLVTPGYKFKMIKGLITNFHQPQSTLLLIIAALCGDNWKMIYQYALDHNFRFLSYGDGCLIKYRD
ncbi:MAG: S-adenosylmethionine:tRNA ribosyltransferase-isomerase [Chitinophagaceae bacterium]|nr:S-adenosylmethionine:tRNA ribosyltransferase-isomerase [Chitinophagaceae bacterium]